MDCRFSHQWLHERAIKYAAVIVEPDSDPQFLQQLRQACSTAHRRLSLSEPYQIRKEGSISLSGYHPNRVQATQTARKDCPLQPHLAFNDTAT